jgi:hypothetical protein
MTVGARWWRVALVVLGVVVIVVSSRAADFPPSYNEVQKLQQEVLDRQLAPPGCAEACIAENITTYRDGVTSDWRFMFLYGVGGALIVVGVMARRGHPLAMGIALGFVALGVGFDLLETLRVNEALGRAARHVAETGTLDGLDLGSVPQLARRFMAAKLASLVIALLVVVLGIPVARRWRSRAGAAA